MARTDSNQGESNISLLLFGIGCLAAGIIVVAWNFRWVRSALAGPVKITNAELAKLEDPATLTNPFVTITLDQTKETGLGISSKSKSGNITEKSRYLLLQVEGRWLIVEVPAKHAGKEVTGYLDKWGTPLRKEAITKIQGKFTDHKLMPYQFDGEYSYRGQCWAMLGLAGFGVVTGLFLIGGWAMSGKQRPRRRRDVEDDI